MLCLRTVLFVQTENGSFMMSDDKKHFCSLVIFCKVVDNFGDIGICWRLAQQLQHEHDIAVTLWVDDLVSFQRICPAIDVGIKHQQIYGVAVRHWRDQAGTLCASDVADIVIEFFGCDIPPGYLQAMAGCTPPPVWLNLEGLSAEDWVEGCHTLPSPHGQLPLTKYFFFPGFTGKTGGLLCESSLSAQRQQFQAEVGAVPDFLAGFGMTPAEIAAFKVSLVCYPHAPVVALFDAWQRGTMSITCLVPEGVAVAAVEAFLGTPVRAGAKRSRGALTVLVLPFVAQPLYDKLLWACDLNFVRGEDSFVRAQWACKPFIWHIYPQDKNLHHVKLAAFLQRYAHDLDGISLFSRCWNDVPVSDPMHLPDWSTLWSLCLAELPKTALHSAEWQLQMAENGDLSSNLMQFAGTLREAARK